MMLVIDKQQIVGKEVPYARLTVGDMQEDKLKDTEEYLSRILGRSVKIETGPE